MKEIIIQYRYLPLIVLLLILCLCKPIKGKDTVTAINADMTGIKTERSGNNTGINGAIEDTMILNGKDDLMKTPNSQDTNFITLERCTVFVLDKKLVPNKTYLGRGDDNYFVKVKTTSGEIGYLYAEYLITKTQLKAHNDSLAMWTKLPMPVYKNLIGTTYWKNSELPMELGSGAFISVGPEEHYGIISVYNKYNDNYSYLFFVEGKGHNEEGDMCLLILDIIPLDWRRLDKDVSLWFQQCECIDTSLECSEIVAVYKHTEKMAKKEIRVIPQKAWKPDYTERRLVEILVETVRCGSMAPEEPGEY